MEQSRPPEVDAEATLVNQIAKLLASQITLIAIFVALQAAQFDSQADMPGGQHGLDNSAPQARPHEYV